MISIAMGANTGGKEAIERLKQAYGLNTNLALCEQLNVSKSTMSNRLLRDSFPADWVIQCALETGVSLLWLATGHGEMYKGSEDHKKPRNETKGTVRPLSKLITPSIPQANLDNGALHSEGEVFLDHSLLSSPPENLLLVKATNDSYIVDQSLKQVSNGYWLVDIDGMKSIAKIARIPGNRIVVHQDDASFECSIDDIEVLGRAQKVIKSI